MATNRGVWVCEFGDKFTGYTGAGDSGSGVAHYQAENASLAAIWDRHFAVAAQLYDGVRMDAKIQVFAPNADPGVTPFAPYEHLYPCIDYALTYGLKLMIILQIPPNSMGGWNRAGVTGGQAWDVVLRPPSNVWPWVRSVWQEMVSLAALRWVARGGNIEDLHIEHVNEPGLLSIGGSPANDGKFDAAFCDMMESILVTQGPFDHCGAQSISPNFVNLNGVAAVAELGESSYTFMDVFDYIAFNNYLSFGNFPVSLDHYFRTYESNIAAMVSAIRSVWRTKKIAVTESNGGVPWHMGRTGTGTGEALNYQLCGNMRDRVSKMIRSWGVGIVTEYFLAALVTETTEQYSFCKGDEAPGTYSSLYSYGDCNGVLFSVSTPPLGGSVVKGTVEAPPIGV